MFVASQKRKENIAEYLLYMWQIEDLIRANDLDIDKIAQNIVAKFSLTEEQQKQMIEWYESLIDMMRREDVISGAKGWLADRLTKSAARFRLDALRHYVSLCAEADYKMKSSSIDDREILMELLMHICSGEIV